MCSGTRTPGEAGAPGRGRGRRGACDRPPQALADGGSLGTGRGPRPLQGFRNARRSWAESVLPLPADPASAAADRTPGKLVADPGPALLRAMVIGAQLVTSRRGPVRVAAGRQARQCRLGAFACAAAALCRSPAMSCESLWHPRGSASPRASTRRSGSWTPVGPLTLSQHRGPPCSTGNTLSETKKLRIKCDQKDHVYSSQHTSGLKQFFGGSAALPR